MVRVVTEGRHTKNDLVAFNQHDAIQRLSELDRPRTSVDWVRVLLRVEPMEVARIGQRLVDLDRALRRFAAFREPRDVIVTFAESGVEFKGRTPYEAIFPMSVDRAGLRLLDAAPGSLDLWLDAFGILGTIFASEPATAMANALQILDSAGRLRVWARRRRTPLARMSAEEAFQVARDLNREIEQLDSEGPADAFVGIGDEPMTHRLPRSRVRLPDGTVVYGRTVTVIRRYDDGTVDVIQAEG